MENQSLEDETSTYGRVVLAVFGLLFISTCLGIYYGYTQSSDVGGWWQLLLLIFGFIDLAYALLFSAVIGERGRRHKLGVVIFTLTLCCFSLTMTYMFYNGSKDSYYLFPYISFLFLSVIWRITTPNNDSD